MTTNVQLSADLRSAELARLSASADSDGAEHFVGAQSKGWGKLGSVGAILIFVGVFGGLFVLWAVPPPQNLGVLVVYGLLYATGFYFLTTTDVHGDSAITKHAVRSAHKKAEKRQFTLYKSGPRTRFGTFRLPGVLAETAMSIHTDARGEEYALIYTPETGDFGVTIKAHPDGATLQRSSDVSVAVTAWGDVLRSLCREPDCPQVQVIIGTRADPGYALKNWLLSKVVDGAPDVSVQLIDELSEDSPKGASSVDTWITITFAGGRTRPPGRLARLWNWLRRRPALEKQTTKTERSMAASLSARLPKIIDDLAASGAGPCRLVSGVELSLDVRMAFDPECVDAVSLARAEGREPQCDWAFAGPSSADNALNFYRHCGGLSRVWTMTEIIGTVYDASLRELFAPHKDLADKRVVITYKLHNPGPAAEVAQKDVTAAQWRINTSANPTTALENNRTSTKVTDIHRSKHGAGIVDIAVQVVCTILDPDRPRRDGETAEDVEARPGIDAMNVVMASLAPSAQLQMRPEDGTHASAFAFTIPGPGIRPEILSNIPVWLKGSI